MNKKTEKKNKNQRIQVFARVRPFTGVEKEYSVRSALKVIQDVILEVDCKNVKQDFCFNKVFPPDTKQEFVYKVVASPLILELIMGRDCIVFLYGQTGTGKTYTMEGERNNTKCSWEDDPGIGIIPRSVYEIFNILKKDTVEFSVRISFLELYNEELFDLLSSTELSRVHLFEDSSKKGSVIIRGLKEMVINSPDEIYSILEEGKTKRLTASSVLNAKFGGYNTVLIISVYMKEIIEGEESLTTGKLYFVTLEGSENVGGSGAVGKRAKRTGVTNLSLFAIERVLSAIMENQPHIPYRQCKLTRLLQCPLQKNIYLSVMTTISQSPLNIEESINALNFASKIMELSKFQATTFKNTKVKAPNMPEINWKMIKQAPIKEPKINPQHVELLKQIAPILTYEKPIKIKFLHNDILKLRKLDNIGFSTFIQESIDSKILEQKGTDSVMLSKIGSILLHKAIDLKSEEENKIIKNYVNLLLKQIVDANDVSNEFEECLKKFTELVKKKKICPSVIIKSIFGELKYSHQFYIKERKI